MTIPSEALMKCTVCGEPKQISEMNSRSRDGKESRCKACQNAYCREYRAKNREKNNKYHREWRANLGDEYRKQCVERRKKRLEAMTGDELTAFRKKETDKTKRLAAVLKDDVFKAYGGYKCACCGETEPMFLSIDHMLNNGNELKKAGVHGKSSTQFYRWLKKSGYPKDFQVLCMNCNIGKHLNNGVCPHQRTFNDYPEMEYSQVAGSARHP